MVQKVDFEMFMHLSRLGCEESEICYANRRTFICDCSFFFQLTLQLAPIAVNYVTNLMGMHDFIGIFADFFYAYYAWELKYSFM